MDLPGRLRTQLSYAEMSGQIRQRKTGMNCERKHKGNERAIWPREYDKAVIPPWLP